MVSTRIAHPSHSKLLFDNLWCLNDKDIFLDDVNGDHRGFSLLKPMTVNIHLYC